MKILQDKPADPCKDESHQKDSFNLSRLLMLQESAEAMVSSSDGWILGCLFARLEVHNLQPSGEYARVVGQKAYKKSEMSK